jgi:hypothetical protein
MSFKIRLPLTNHKQVSDRDKILETNRGIRPGRMPSIRRTPSQPKKIPCRRLAQHPPLSSATPRPVPAPHRFFHTRPFELKSRSPHTSSKRQNKKKGKTHALHSLACHIVHATTALLLLPCPCLSRLRTQCPQRANRGTKCAGPCLSHCRALYLSVNAHPAHSVRNFLVFSTVGNPPSLSLSIPFFLTPNLTFASLSAT